ncbi:hypothetical protein ACIHAR_29695 [Streptomyces sp. NPDC052016]|uniref:hypothetical protein n=1 Tax=Streptomyces sp. NPDC052016 TaxID=3365680 RepID=UPI0037CED020
MDLMIKETRLMTETAVENEQAEPVVQAPPSAGRMDSSLRCWLTGPGTKGCS